MTKTEIINGIIAREGGYSDDLDDSGGKTKFGITERTARRHGYKGEMIDLSRDRAFQIYEQIYWIGTGCDKIAELSEKVAEEVCDTAVNLGVARAGQFFQRCLNVLNKKSSIYGELIVDGNVGPKTIANFASYMVYRKNDKDDVFLKAMDSLQGAFYIELAEMRVKDEEFIYGWLANRTR